MTEKIPMFVENQNGHETVEVPKEKVEKKVKEQLRDNKWVSVEKGDGKTELLTQKDLPKNPEEDIKWAERFENVKSITSTKTVKGG